MRKLLLAVSALWLLVDYHAAEAQLSGPILGYTVDTQASGIRLIKGIPGASALGKPLDVEVRVRKAVVSLERDYALAVADDTGDLTVISSLSQTRSLSGIAGAVSGADTLALSPDGSVAVAYSVEQSRIQVIGGLPANPVLRFEFDTGTLGSQTLTAIGVNGREQVLAAFSNGTTGTLYSIGAGADARLIARVGLVWAIAFPVAGDSAAVVDRAANQALLIQNLSTAATPIQLANDADGLSDPVGILFSRDAQTAFVANAGSGTVTVVDLAGGALQNLACTCDLTTMRELRGDSVFVLTERPDQPLVVFDGGRGQPRFVFVPPENQN